MNDRVRRVAPFACAVFWATQTLAVRAYVVSGRHISAQGVLVTVAAAEAIKASAAVVTTQWEPPPPRLRLLVCAFCSVSCNAMAYAVLERTTVMVYIALMGWQLPMRLIFDLVVHGAGAYSHRRLLASAFGAAAFAAGATQCTAWSAAAVVFQTYLVCFAEALDAEGEGDTHGAEHHHALATVVTAWTAAMVATGAIIADAPAAVLSLTQPSPPYSIATVVLMAAVGMARTCAAGGPAWPATCAAVEAVIVAVGAFAVLGEVITPFEGAGAAAAVFGVKIWERDVGVVVRSKVDEVEEGVSGDNTSMPLES